MIIVATDDETYTVDGDLSMTLENLKAVLEADTSIPATSQDLFCNGKRLSGETSSLELLGVKADDLLMLLDTRTAQPSGSRSNDQRSTSASQQHVTAEQEADTIRQEMLRNPALMAQLRATRPDLADAITSNPARFVEMLHAERQRNLQAEREAMQLAAADDFDIDAQRRIEEAIRQEQVMENFGSAMEFNPESFGRVTMLYVDTQVNNHPIKAFVDSGAQATIMSPECAERCGLMRLIDRRFAGIARGVGTAKILGRVHSAQIKLGDDLFLPCSFTIMEGKAVDLLFGLDMLKRHSCLIDLGKNALIVHGREVRFLDEHELPPAARGEGLDDEDEDTNNTAGHAADTANANAAAAAAAATTTTTSKAAQSFPGQGSTLGVGSTTSNSARSAPAPATIEVPATSTSHTKSWPAASMQALKDLGASDAQAKAFLDASGGNVEIAASLLFQQ